MFPTQMQFPCCRSVTLLAINIAGHCFTLQPFKNRKRIKHLYFSVSYFLNSKTNISWEQLSWGKIELIKLYYRQQKKSAHYLLWYKNKVGTKDGLIAHGYLFKESSDGHVRENIVMILFCNSQTQILGWNPLSCQNYT